MNDLDKYAALAAEVASTDFLLRLVQERDGLQKLLVRWETFEPETALEAAQADGIARAAKELRAVIAARADQSS